MSNKSTTRKASPKKPVRKASPRATSVAKLQERLDKQQLQIDTLVWLHAELAYALKKAAAQQVAARMGPQIQEAITQRILTGVK